MTSRRPPSRARSATLPPMAAPEQDESFVEKLSRQGEEALGRIAEELIANPVVNGAIARAFEAREKAVQAQEAAMGALNLPSAADIERVTRRLRSLSQRLEGDRGRDRPARGAPRRRSRAQDAARRASSSASTRSRATSPRCASRSSPSGSPVPRAQERLTVTES